MSCGVLNFGFSNLAGLRMSSGVLNFGFGHLATTRLDYFLFRYHLTFSRTSVAGQESLTGRQTWPPRMQSANTNASIQCFQIQDNLGRVVT